MTTLRWIQTFALFIGLTAIANAATSAQDPTTGRRVRWSSDIPLKDVVTPGDTKVSVLKPEHYEPFIEEKTAQQELLLRADNADDVLVAEIASVTPIVTENGTWVTTEITARVTQVLRHNDEFPRKNPGNWQIVHDGGEILIDGVVVKVGMYPVVKTGQRYLMFTSHHRRAGTTHAGPAFLLDSRGILVTSETSVDGPLPSVLNGMKLSDVARLLRAK